ncbi:MAG: hypothetical protein LBJ11_03845 [Oscillospiraceae bacterium]|jgi:hypothetical protein|nr:hypothetical protein [Oscillospiraceae bacterium]
MKELRSLLFYALQFTWALPQNLAGGIAYLILSRKYRHERFHEAFVTYIRAENFGGVSLGMFVFMNPDRPDDWKHDTQIHEFGHSVQSIVLGPLYWIVVAAPSFLWCNLSSCIRYREEKQVSYYWLFCEGWANLWGTAWTGERFESKEMLTAGRFGKAWKQA